MNNENTDNQQSLGEATHEPSDRKDTTIGFAENNLDTVDDSLAAKTRILACLKEQNVASVEVDYDGCDDSGCVDSITATKEDGTTIELEEATKEAIEEYVCETLPDGWEIDDGSYGTISFNVATESIHFSHNTRYTESFLDEWEK
jgi:hypothetical protein